MELKGETPRLFLEQLHCKGRMFTSKSIFSMCARYIFVPRGRDRFGHHQKSRPLVGAHIFFCVRRVLVLHFQPIRFTRFEKDSVNRGLSVLEPTRGSQSLVLNRRIAVSGDKNARDSKTTNYAQ